MMDPAWARLMNLVDQRSILYMNWYVFELHLTQPQKKEEKNRYSALENLSFPFLCLFFPGNDNNEFCIMQAELMYDTIREWPRYVKVPFPVAKASSSGTHPCALICCWYYVTSNLSLAGVCWIFPHLLFVICLQSLKNLIIGVSIMFSTSMI